MSTFRELAQAVDALTMPPKTKVDDEDFLAQDHLQRANVVHAAVRFVAAERVRRRSRARTKAFARGR